MSYYSEIEWTDTTRNPVTGCTKVSEGCDHCYAERIAERFRGTPGHPYAQGFDLTLHPERLESPLHWLKPRKVFVNSMSDLFHKNVPKTSVGAVFDVTEYADHRIYQILTKRSSPMRDYLRRRYIAAPAPQHIRCGVPVEDRQSAVRIGHPVDAPVMTRFISVEPLLGSIVGPVLYPNNIHWVIVGGESGPGARYMQPEWVRGIRDYCAWENVSFFFKQWCGRTPKAGGRLPDGVEHNALPAYLGQGDDHREVKMPDAYSWCMA